MTDLIDPTTDPLPTIDHIHALLTSHEPEAPAVLARRSADIARVCLREARDGELYRATLTTLAKLVVSGSDEARGMAESIERSGATFPEAKAGLSVDEFHVVNRRARLVATGWYAYVLGMQSLQMLEDGKVINYLDLNFTTPAPQPKSFVVTVQREERPTAHELRLAAERERDAAKEEAADLHAHLTDALAALDRRAAACRDLRDRNKHGDFGASARAGEKAKAYEHAAELIREEFGLPRGENRHQATTRPETGTMRFDGDWRGVFVRGDDAFGYATSLRAILDGVSDPSIDVTLPAMALRGLLELLVSADERRGASTTNDLQSFAGCVRGGSEDARAVDADLMATMRAVVESLPRCAHVECGAFATYRLDDFSVGCDAHHEESIAANPWLKNQPELTYAPALRALLSHPAWIALTAGGR